MKNTLAKFLATGEMSQIEVNYILDCLFDSVSDDLGSSVYFGDFDIIGRVALQNIVKDDRFNVVNFDGLCFIKTDDIKMWRLHALTTPISFEGDYTVDSDNSDHPFN